jgi:hypothetical protein
VTHDGQSFTSFVAKVLREAILIGRYGGLVDAMPDGSRVYMVGYPAESIINIRTRYVGGTKQPTLIVLEESVETWEDPFAMDERRIYRTLSWLQGDLGKPEYQQGIFNPDAERQLSGRGGREIHADGARRPLRFDPVHVLRRPGLSWSESSAAPCWTSPCSTCTSTDSWPT